MSHRQLPFQLTLDLSENFFTYELLYYNIPKYNTITHGKKCFMYEGAKLWNSISNGIKTIENISEFKTLLKKWNGSPCICKNCIICTISYM